MGLASGEVPLLCGYGLVWLSHSPWERKTAGSNPATRTILSI